MFPLCSVCPVPRGRKGEDTENFEGNLSLINLHKSVFQIVALHSCTKECLQNTALSSPACLSTNKIVTLHQLVEVARDSECRRERLNQEMNIWEGG